MDFFPIPSSVLTTAIAALLISLFITITKRLLLRPSRNRNYPPIAATIFHAYLNLHRLAEYQISLSKKYKTFRFLTPFVNYVSTVDPANIEYILKTNFSNYEKGDFNCQVLSDLLGDGIFAVNGEKWRQQREIASFQFSTKMLRDYSSRVFNNSTVKLSQIISDFASSNQ